MTTEHDLMRHLLVDLPAGDRRHILEVVDRNHAEQLRQKRWSLRRGALGEQDVANDDLEADDREADDP